MAFVTLLLKQHPWAVVSAALIGVLGGLANARLLSVVNESLDNVAEQSASPGFYVLLLVLALVAGVFSEVLLILLSEKVAANLRLNLCSNIIDLPLRRSQTLGEARLTAAFTQDIPAITQALLRIPTLFVNGSVTLGCMVYLGFLSPAIMGVLIGFVILALLSYLVPERLAIRYLNTWREGWDHLLSQFRAMNQGASELKLHAPRREAFLHEVLTGAVDQVRRSGYGHKIVYAVLTHWSQIMFFLFLGVLLFVLPDFSELDTKTITGFALTALYLVGPIDQLINAVPRFRTANVAISRMQTAGLELEPAPMPLPHVNAMQLPQSAPEIRLDGIIHTYYREREEREFALGPINLTIRPGELVYIVGGNGSGKTTLARLIAGLYEPGEGALLCNGEAVDDENRDWYRQHFSAIFSHFHVFEQILGLDMANLDERAQHYLKKLHLDHKVAVLEGTLSTTSLSTGQRKRLALLTAYLEDRPIYLFDEWAADQDPEFKKVFYRELLPELRERGKTVLVISHDDHYFDGADRIIKLADGQIIEARVGEVCN